MAEEKVSEGAYTYLTDPMDGLDNLEKIYVRQPLRGMEMFLEMCCGWNVANRFEVGYNGKEGAVGIDNKPDFKRLFWLEEESNCILRQCCQVQRPLIFKALAEKDNDASLLFTIDRPYRMNCCCIPGSSGCLGKDYMKIITNKGDIIGELETVKNCLCTCDTGYSFRILDGNRNEICVLTRDNCCVCACGGNVEFKIFIDEEDTGKVIAKTWNGALKEIFTDYDNFCIEIPEQFKNNRYYKLLLISASMLLDLKFFETPKDQHHSGAHNLANM